MTSTILTLDQLKKAVENDAAIRGRATLQPAGGPGDKLFPPTHLVDRNEKRPGAKYARERRRVPSEDPKKMDGDEHDVVLLDSVQSQANRMEEALQHLWRDKQIALPVIVVDFGEKFPDLREVSSLTAPHRISDALLRDSRLGEMLFRHSELGKSFTDATPQAAAPLFKVCPTALVFGLWDSTGPKGGLGFKLARNLISEIVGIDAVYGTKTSSRIDPTGIVTNAGRLYEAADRGEQWTLLETEGAPAARMEKNKDGQDQPVPFKDGKPTSALHSNIPPTLDLIAGGVTVRYATQTVVVSLAGLRRLSFGSKEDDAQARTTLAALALLAVVAASERGYDLRSRCHLVPEPGKKLAFERVSKDGSPAGFDLDLPTAIALFTNAVEALPDSLRWRKDDLATGAILGKGEPLATLTPTPKLAKLLEESRRRSGAGEAEDQGD